MVYWQDDNHRVVDECVKMFVGVTHADVLSHEAWYRTYSHLLAQKKDAISRWKEEREVTLCKDTPYILS
jgi:hypothetical protein